MVEVGKAAPDFKLESHAGGTVSKKDLAGQWAVIYFYPKDSTPGCTTEACDFRDGHAKLKKAGAVVLGVSPDSETRHTKFREKYSLPFDLLADVDHAVAEKFGAWGEKSLYGKKYMGIIRSTFLIDPDGKVKKVWPKVKVKGHADEVLAALKS